MARPLTPLGALGAKVAASLDEGTDERRFAIKRAERLFLASRVGTKSGSRFRRGFGLVLAGALLASTLLWFGLLRAPRRLEFTVDGAPGQAQTWLAAPAARPVVVAFSDGTVVKVDPLSRARVVDTDPNGASLVLQNGHLSG